MDPKSSTERSIAALAGRPHGHVTRTQLLKLGLSDQEIKLRTRKSFLIRVHHGVYAVGHRRSDPMARACAGVLACGAGAVLSHYSAPALWGFRKRWPTLIEITSPTDHRRRGIKPHRSITLTRRDITVHWGIRVTKPARTLLDIAPSLTESS